METAGFAGLVSLCLRVGRSRSLTRVVMTQQTTNTWHVLKQLQTCGLSWKPLALPGLSRYSSWWRSAGHSPEWPKLNNQQTPGMSLNKCKYLKHLVNCQPCRTCLVMPPGGDKGGAHSDGHNSTTVGPIEQKLTFLKSSETALHSDRQQNINKHLQCFEISANV